MSVKRTLGVVALILLSVPAMAMPALDVPIAAASTAGNAGGAGVRAAAAEEPMVTTPGSSSTHSSSSGRRTSSRSWWAMSSDDRSVSWVGQFSFHDGALRVTTHELFVRQPDGSMRCAVKMVGLRDPMA